MCMHLSLTSQWLCYLGYLAGQPPSLSCIEAKTDLFTVLGAPGGHIQYSGNNFSLGAATRLGVSDSKL